MLASMNSVFAADQPNVPIEEFVEQVGAQATAVDNEYLNAIRIAGNAGGDCAR